MSSPAHVEPLGEQPVDRPAALPATQPFYWSVRRELWEHRAVYIAPLVVAGVVVVGFVIRLASLPQTELAVASLPTAPQASNLERPYAIAAAAIIFCALIVGVFYCLGALNNERRDRTILFWKSLPVSDPTTVLSKAFIPLVALPVVVFAITVVTQLVMLILGSAVLLVNGLDPATIWTHWPMLRMSVGLLYCLVILTLWYAPIYGWLLLVSGWARRMPILWATLPLLGLCLVERIGFNTSHIVSLLVYRLQGFVSEGFGTEVHGKVIDHLAFLTPGRFFGSPGLWLGLIAAVAFLGAAVWLRRYREPG